ncbi:hypothetical protein F5Y16DRAFT_422840 [Xylariaceae sp. FL0255]|nr:hypothetical protein F5Y16DRAFT_422840 [Xylariaceae sp. FL0255]
MWERVDMIDAVNRCWYRSNRCDTGLKPFLNAVGYASFPILKLLQAADGSLLLAVPFACSFFLLMPKGFNTVMESQLEVLRYLLDAGADLNAKKWGHKYQGYANDFDRGNGLNVALATGRHELAEELLR